MPARQSTNQRRGGRKLRAFFRRRTPKARRYDAPVKSPITPRLRRNDPEAALNALAAAKKGLPSPTVGGGEIARPNGKVVPATLIYAPRKLALFANFREFLGFIYEYQWMQFVARPSTPSFAVDLSHVATIDLAAALVLTAEYDRILRLGGGGRPLINDADWPPHVRSALQMLGFYNLVRACGRTGEEAPEETNVTFVPFHSGLKIAGEEADKLIDALCRVGGEAPERHAVYAALVEAIANVVNHAYPIDRPSSVVPMISRWWAAGSFDPDEELLQFVVYDQGVGMPYTLPQYLSSIGSDLTVAATPPNDATLIARSVLAANSRTFAPERGNGLRMICGVVTELGGSFVRILSGRGEVTYFGPDHVQKKLRDNPFCGTLIQWTLKLPTRAAIADGIDT